MRKGNLLGLSLPISMSISSKNDLTETSRTKFEHISEYPGPAKLTHEINYHTISHSNYSPFISLLPQSSPSELFSMGHQVTFLKWKSHHVTAGKKHFMWLSKNLEWKKIKIH